LEADLGVSRRDRLAYGTGLDFDDLTFNTVGNPWLLKQLGGQIDAAVAIGTRNRFCLE
jgi:hypothetical protein